MREYQNKRNGQRTISRWIAHAWVTNGDAVEYQLIVDGERHAWPQPLTIEDVEARETAEERTDRLRVARDLRFEWACAGCGDVHIGRYEIFSSLGQDHFCSYDCVTAKVGPGPV